MGGTATGSGGGSVRALKKNKYGRDGKGSRSGPKKWGGESGDSVISPEELIDWKVARLAVIEEVQKKKKPVVLFFIEEGMDAVTASREIHDAELATMAKDGEAFFLLVEHNADRTPSLSTGSPIPTSLLTDANLGRAYNISTYPSLLICDPHGNEYRRFSRAPGAGDIKKRIEEVSAFMEVTEHKLRKNLDLAKAKLESKDLRNFFKIVLKNFREGVVGLDAQNESIKVYREVLDNARDEIDEILEDRPRDAMTRLRAMSKSFRDTELDKEIDDAIEIIKG